MSNELQTILQYENGTNIEVIEHNEARYWSANDLYKASDCRKQLVKFFSSEQYEALLEGAKQYYASDMKKKHITFEPTYTKKGNFSNGERQGTWIHEDLVVGLARWLNPKFSFWCDMKVRELLQQGYVINDSLTTGQLTKLNQELDKLNKKYRNLLTSVRELSYEHEAHKIFAFLYSVVHRHIKSEVMFNNSRFDFVEFRSRDIVVVELKAKTLSKSVLAHELSNLKNGKNYFERAQELSKLKNKPVRIKFLAPRVNEQECLDYLQSLADHSDIRFDFATWESETDYLQDKFKSHYPGITSEQMTRVFGEPLLHLSEIRTGKYKTKY